MSVLEIILYVIIGGAFITWVICTIIDWKHPERKQLKKQAKKQKKLAKKGLTEEKKEEIINDKEDD